MVMGAPSGPASNGTHVTEKPIELAITMAQNSGTKVQLHLTILDKSMMVLLTTASIDATQSGASLGSLVYAIPDRYNPSQPLSTPLYTQSSSIDFASRMAKVLVRRTTKPCYVSSSINLSDSAAGGSVSEEMEAFKVIVDVVMKEVASREAT